MDITNITIGNKSNSSNVIAEIDKHIEIRFLKEGRRNKTYVYGLIDYIGGEEKDKNKNLQKFVEKLQKRLGTSMLEEEKDGKKSYAFGGDHVNTIKTIVMSELKVPKEKVKT